VINKKQYALPYESVPTLMYVNKTLLEKEGILVPSNTWTWEDFYNISKQVTKDINKDGNLDQFGFYGYTWENAVASNNGSIFNAEK
ncbi:MAG: extracellular solute-binding protein, partial [Anaerorhabdus sp.]